MKIWMILLLCLLVLTGCAAEETFETVSDRWVWDAAEPARQMVIALPEEAAAPVSYGDGKLYQCEGYEILLYTLSSGDVNRSIRSTSGFDSDALTVIRTQWAGMEKYEFVWASAGETGERLGRAVLVDDGNYHYVLSVMADADRAGTLAEKFNVIFQSLSLESY